MIDFEKILTREGFKKQDFAGKLGENPTNLKRTFNRLQKNLSEIDDILREMNTSLKQEIGGTSSDRLLSIIESQQRVIERLSLGNSVGGDSRSFAARREAAGE